MDFDLSEEQQAVYDLAQKVFEGHVTRERFRELGDERFDRDLWKALADAGLLGISLPAEAGGSEQGFLATALLVEQAGRHAAPVPVLWSSIGALAVARFGSPALRDAVLPGAVKGELVLAVALDETCVAAATIADRIVVAGDTGVVVVDPSGPGVTVTPLKTTAGTPAGRVTVEDGVGEPLAEGAAEWIRAHATAALCSQMAGAAKQAVALTAEYVKTREQFDRPIATFQAVAQRAADAYIDAEAIHLTSRQAAWRLDAGLPAAEQVAIAKFWAADGGQRVVHAATHLHGGVGVDRDYPLHRYFLMAKEIELTLGGATANLLRLGHTMATSP